MASKKKLYAAAKILVKCKSGRVLAYYESRSDIIANGESEKDAIINLKKMHSIIKQDKNEEGELMLR